MKALLLRRFGGPEVFESAQVECPGCQADQMLVKVAACGVCGHDLLTRAGHFVGTRLPAIIGHEIAGTVVQVGSGVTSFSPGDRVALLQRQPCGRCRSCLADRENLCRSGGGFYGEDSPGGYGEYVVATERNAVLLPQSIPFHVGAVLSCALGTGFHALCRARVRAGDAIVITGATGGVGIHTVQVARMMGLTTIAICSSSAKIPQLRAAGADEVIVTADHRFHEPVRALLAGDGAEAVIEIAGTPTFDSSLRSLRPGGRMVLVGNVNPGVVSVNPAVAILKEIELIGSAHAILSDLRQIVDLVQRERLSPTIAATLPVTEAARAHQKVQDRSSVGRVVLTHA